MTKAPNWYALRVNGKIIDVVDSLSAAIDNAEGNASYMTDWTRLKDGPIIFDVVPVQITEPTRTCAARAKGGHARALSMTAEERKAIASKAAKARWKRP